MHNVFHHLLALPSQFTGTGDHTKISYKVTNWGLCVDSKNVQTVDGITPKNGSSFDKNVDHVCCLLCCCTVIIH